MLKKGIFAVLTLLILTGVVGYYLWPKGLQTPVLPEPPLKDLAKQHNIQVGNFAILTLINEKPYSDILTSQFDFVLADNTPNWHFTDNDLRPSVDKYDYSKLDEVFAYAKKHNMPVQAHHYVWGEEKWLPDWLKNGKYTSDQLKEIIHQHILNVGGHYKGRVQEWSVVNEAFSRNQHIYGLRDWWTDNIGDTSYIDQSFIWARQADPNAKLILNDFGNEGKNDISNAMYDYIKGAKARGVPIDGIGMQMHIDGSHPTTKEEVVSNMQRFGELGVKVYVTELDVNMNDVPASDDAKNNIEGKIYYEMMRACIESKVCPSFAILGITDKETWYNHMGLSNARPLPFDKDYNPKPAFYSFRDALMQQ
jgi:endo-1,4-beta-xylanase